MYDGKGQAGLTKMADEGTRLALFLLSIHFRHSLATSALAVLTEIQREEAMHIWNFTDFSEHSGSSPAVTSAFLGYVVPLEAHRCGLERRLCW